MGDSRAHSRSEAKQAREWAKREAQAQVHWDRVGAPFLASVEAELGALKDKVDSGHEAREARQEWLSRHPEAARRLDSLDHEVSKAREAIHLERSIANGVRQRTQAIEAARDFGRERGRSSIGR
jgi:hypothetical protein